MLQYYFRLCCPVLITQLSLAILGIWVFFFAFLSINSAKMRHFHLLFYLHPPFLSSLFPDFTHALLLTDIVLYLYTFANLLLPELSFSPIHSPLGSCISVGHYSYATTRYTGAVRQPVQCQHAINVQAVRQVSASEPSHIPCMWLLMFRVFLWRDCLVQNARGCDINETPCRCFSMRWPSHPPPPFTHRQLKFECSTCVSVLSCHADLLMNGN